jgi:hypothetical protein
MLPNGDNAEEVKLKLHILQAFNLYLIEEFYA